MKPPVASPIESIDPQQLAQVKGGFLGLLGGLGGGGLFKGLGQGGGLGGGLLGGLGAGGGGGVAAAPKPGGG